MRCTPVRCTPEVHAQVHTHEVHAHAHEVHAHEVHAYEVHAQVVLHAHEVHAYEVHAQVTARANFRPAHIWVARCWKKPRKGTRPVPARRLLSTKAQTESRLRAWPWGLPTRRLWR